MIATSCDLSDKFIVEEFHVFWVFELCWSSVAALASIVLLTTTHPGEDSAFKVEREHVEITAGHHSYLTIFQRLGHIIYLLIKSRVTCL